MVQRPKPEPGRGPAEPLVLEGAPLTIPEVVAVARHGRAVQIGAGARARLASSRRRLESLLEDGCAHYGVNTGFGSLAGRRIGAGDLRDLQRNLVRSHAAGVGNALEREAVRGTMLLLAASLCRGLSGVRPEVADALAALLTAGVTPVVPETGSVGASGDLAPLAHIALVLLGEGRAEHAGRVLDGAAALAGAGLRPLVLEAKEGLALVNGTHLMAARAALVLEDVDRLLDWALAATAMSIDACRATDRFLDERVHEARRQPGQRHVAGRLRELLRASQIVASHRENDPRVQDPYSLRCAPQVLGAVHDAILWTRGVVEAELGAVTDNPLVFEAPGASAAARGAQAEIVSGGNFHGMPLAVALDVLGIAVAHLAGISERRVYHMLSGPDGTGLPAFLARRPGLHSGLMIAQYTAAACCNELIGLAAPASVANIPTSAGMEDYNSFGPRAAAKAARAAGLARSVVAIELLCAAEALEHHRPLRSGEGVERAHALVRARVAALVEDRPPAPDIAELEALVRAAGPG